MPICNLDNNTLSPVERKALRIKWLKGLGDKKGNAFGRASVALETIDGRFDAAILAVAEIGETSLVEGLTSLKTRAAAARSVILSKLDSARREAIAAAERQAESRPEAD
jgi:hypothetical protein